MRYGGFNLKNEHKLKGLYFIAFVAVISRQMSVVWSIPGDRRKRIVKNEDEIKGRGSKATGVLVFWNQTMLFKLPETPIFKSI